MYQINNYKRRLYGGSSKSWCRIAAMSRSVRAPFLSSFTRMSQPSSYTNSTGVTTTRKVFLRTFRNKKLCREFITNVKKDILEDSKKTLILGLIQEEQK